MNWRQAELATLSRKRGNSVTQTELKIWYTYIIIKRKQSVNTTEQFTKSTTMTKYLDVNV